MFNIFSVQHISAYYLRTVLQRTQWSSPSNRQIGDRGEAKRSLHLKELKTTRTPFSGYSCSKEGEAICTLFVVTQQASILFSLVPLTVKSVTSCLVCMKMSFPQPQDAELSLWGEREGQEKCHNMVCFKSAGFCFFHKSIFVTHIWFGAKRQAGFSFANCKLKWFLIDSWKEENKWIICLFQNKVTWTFLSANSNMEIILYLQLRA